MADPSTIVALIVAGAALIIAAGQLAQQLLSTAYEQFRYTVTYRAVIFALPASIYSALRVKNTVQVHSPSQDLWSRSIRLRPTRATAVRSCWISFVQDLIACACIKPEGIGLNDESGDRVPIDLTVAPTQGDIDRRGVGSVSSSTHPILGGLLHYNVFTNEPTIGFEAARRNGRALLQEEGVWANAVFGRFKDRSYRPEFTTLETLRRLKLGVLKAIGWPQNSHNDTTGGAACFLAFSHTDIYEGIPPSSVRPWCAHFAEAIVKSHLMQLSKGGPNPQIGLSISSTSYRLRQAFIDGHGCSSPHLPWESLNTRPIASVEKNPFDLQLDSLPLLNPESASVLAFPSLIDCAIESETSSVSVVQDFAERDPSSYIPMDTAWEAILQADHRLRLIYTTHGQWPDQTFKESSELIAASAIRSLAEGGAPS